MKTFLFTLLMICTLAFTCCPGGKGNGKNGYTISELYNSNNEDVQNDSRKAGVLFLCKGEELYYGTESVTDNSKRIMKVSSDGKHLLPKIDEESEAYYENKNGTDLYLSLDGLSYANVSKPIEEDDWFYMEYHESENRFYFYYVDLDKINIKND